MNQELQNYIKQMHEQGFSDEQIREELKKAGWSEEQIEAEIIDTPNPNEQELPKEVKEGDGQKKGLDKKIIAIIAGAVLLLSAGGAFGALYTDMWNPGWDPFAEKQETTEGVAEQNLNEQAEVASNNKSDKKITPIETFDNLSEAMEYAEKRMFIDNAEVLPDGSLKYTHPSLGWSMVFADGWRTHDDSEYGLELINDGIYVHSNPIFSIYFPSRIFYSREAIDKIIEAGYYSDRKDFYATLMELNSADVKKDDLWAEQNINGHDALIYQKDTQEPSYNTIKSAIFETRNNVFVVEFALDPDYYRKHPDNNEFDKEILEDWGKGFNDMYNELDGMLNSFELGDTIADLDYTEIENKYWDIAVKNKAKILVSAYKGYPEPTYFPANVVEDSWRIDRVAGDGYAIYSYYECGDRGVLEVNYTAKGYGYGASTSNKTEGVENISDSVVYDPKINEITLSTPDQSRVLIKTSQDCSISKEELIKFAENMK